MHRATKALHCVARNRGWEYIEFQMTLCIPKPLVRPHGEAGTPHAGEGARATGLGRPSAAPWPWCPYAAVSLGRRRHVRRERAIARDISDGAMPPGAFFMFLFEAESDEFLACRHPQRARDV